MQLRKQSVDSGNCAGIETERPKVSPDAFDSKATGSPQTARIHGEIPTGELKENGKAVTPGLVREIDISTQARTLRLLRFSDYALVILCGFTAIGIVTELITNPPVNSYPWLIVFVIMAAVFSLSVYTGISNVGVIDPSNWQSYLIAFPSILVLCGSIIGAAWVEISENKGLRPAVDQTTFVGMLSLLWIAAAAFVGFLSVLLLRRTRIKALNVSLIQLLSHLRSRRGARAGKGKGVKKVNAPYGLLLCVVAAVLLLVPVPKELLGSSWWLGALGFFLLMRARRYFQVDADSLLSVDKRKPILFLRSFDDDEKNEKEKLHRAGKALLDFSLELRLSNHFTYFGPFIAIGSPKEKVPQPGAARVLLSDQEWQPRVVSWMNEASLIIMYSGTTHWVNWELAKIIETERAPNLILLIPEIRKRSRRQRTEDISTRINRLGEAFKDTRWNESLAALRDLPAVRAMLFDADGSMVVIRSRPRNRESYHLAALIAHYLILDRTAKEVDGVA